MRAIDHMTSEEVSVLKLKGMLPDQKAKSGGCSPDYKAHAERLAEVAQSVIDEARDGLNRSAWRLEKAREALAQWKGAQ